LIGCELASDLDKAGDAVTIYHRESRLMELQYDEAQSQALHEHFASRGVAVHYHQDIREIFPRALYDGVVVSTGFAPRIELARDAGLATARGIVVNSHLRTEDPAVYAVGDVAEVEGRLYAFRLADPLAGALARPASCAAQRRGLVAPAVHARGEDPRLQKHDKSPHADER
jgi:NAD(P)H-nitrite reductase large subunit